MIVILLEFALELEFAFEFEISLVVYPASDAWVALFASVAVVLAVDCVVFTNKVTVEAFSFPNCTFCCCR